MNVVTSFEIVVDVAKGFFLPLLSLMVLKVDGDGSMLPMAFSSRHSDSS